MAQAGQIAELIHAIKDIHNSRILSVVAVTLTLYDWLLSFAGEYETIYQSRWTLPKALFFYIRIVTPPGLILTTYQLSDLRGPLSKPFCTAWAFLQVFGMLSSMIAANALLTLRLIALYRRKSYMVWFIRLFFVASYAATLGLMIVSMVTFHDGIFYSERLKICGTTASSDAFKAIFYAPAAFEFFVFALTAWRGWQDAKVITGVGSAPFLIVLYRDGFVSFFVMVAIRIWNIWIYLTQPLTSYNLGTLLMWAISTVLTTRVYMNLVWLAKKPMVGETTIGLGTRNVQTGPSIRMRVTTFTEIKTDDWKAGRAQNIFGAENDGFDRR